MSKPSREKRKSNGPYRSQLSPESLTPSLFLAHHLRKGSIAGTLTIDLGSGGGVFARRPDALLALRPLEKENAWRAEPTVRCFSRIGPFGVRLRFPLLERDDPLALIELYGAANVDWGQPSCAVSGR